MNSILDQVIPNDTAAGPQGPVTEQHAPRVWSSYQEEIFSCVRDEGSSILVQAVAGSGKTTTIVEAVRRAAGRSLFLAFNKSIAEELRSRIGSAGECKTLNALGHRLIMQNRPRAQLDMDKLKKIAKRIIPGDDFGDWGYSVIRGVGLAKNNAVGLDYEPSLQDFTELLDNYLDIPSDVIEKVGGWTKQAFTLSLQDKDTFDFDDQLYVPIYENWTYPSFDNVFVDEAQDLSPIQHLMLAAMHDSRIIAVGDRHQAIYGFRGASHTSMDLLKDRFRMTELPLSISYRCPQAVVRLAQRYCPEIQFKEHANEGSVLNRGDQIDPETQLPFYSDPSLYKEGLVLCRTNGPLFKAILRHIRAKEPCRVLSNFLDSFQSFVKSLARGRRGGAEAMSSSEALRALDRWYDKECQAADGRRGKLAHLEDKYETVRLLLEEYPTVSECVEAVRRLAASRTGPTFSTIHKAKGLETPKVYILRPDLMPSPWAQGEAELQQEDNLSYVAITRAIDELTFGVRERR
jgi:DNA helicase-2/ATP-dependent DNA helicase PcrA